MTLWQEIFDIEHPLNKTSFIVDNKGIQVRTIFDSITGQPPLNQEHGSFASIGYARGIPGSFYTRTCDIYALGTVLVELGRFMNNTHSRSPMDVYNFK
jgi:hypothetical protein